MVLMRRELGDVLRAERRDQQRSLRDVSAAASVSLGYLSEIERGEKEASSELLGSICDALGMPLSVVLHELADRVAVVERLSSPVALTVSVADDFNGVSASAA
ncbi:MAG: helix-turn-helix transcriptional regulator [Candidatus Phosphoribacter sp.]|nr:helix-turn-helix transcriptional regulator [Actinomycetales bacterium]